METAGILCEFNPFHLGHQRLVSYAHDLGATVVCLMSGRYVQRGAPALFAPALRAEAALLGGADLVLELPLTVALSSAEGFAAGGVEIFSALGLEGMVFGSESGDVGQLLELANLLQSDALSGPLHRYLDQGLSFPAAREKAAQELGADGTLLRRPNSILAVEYCKAILAQGSVLRPVVLMRPGDYHSALPDSANPSATALRQALLTGGPWEAMTIPSCRSLYRAGSKHTWQAGERAVLARLRAMGEEEFEALPYGGEGLWRKFFHACQRETTLEAIQGATKSKRYSHTRLCRMAMCAFLGLTQQDMQKKSPYLRVLGFNDRGRALLRRWRERKIPLCQAGQTMTGPYAQLEHRARALYGLFAQEVEAPSPAERVVYCRQSGELRYSVTGEDDALS